MALMHRRRDIIPTYIYEDNYGCRRNINNQPMKDYSLAQRKGENPQYPQSPWSNERASDTNWSSYSNKVPDYSDAIHSNQINTKRYSSDDQVNRTSSTSIRNSALRSQLKKRPVHLPSFEEKLIRDIQDREDQRRIKAMMDDIEQIKVRFNTDKDVQLSSGLKKSIRGKSATQITAALLADSEKNIRESKSREVVQMNSRQCRGTSESRIIKRVTHVELLDDRMVDQLDHSMSSSLYDVKKQLQSFNKRNEDLYYNSRWRKSYFK